MRLNRRGLLTGGLAGAAIFAISLVVTPAWALTSEQARQHVAKTVDQLVSLLKQPGTAESRAPQLRQIMVQQANMPLIAKFSAGRVWRQMTPTQQKKFVDAFEHYVAVAYARRFNEYSGNPVIHIGSAVDAGQKGFLVASPIEQEQGKPIDVQWLVSDRAGSVQIVDLIIEGISMATTQREEIASMYDKRGGDVDALIADLAATG